MTKDIWSNDVEAAARAERERGILDGDGELSKGEAGGDEGDWCSWEDLMQIAKEIDYAERCNLRDAPRQRDGQEEQSVREDGQGR